MNIVEAKLAMENGIKITHEYFTDDEWVTCGGDLYYIFEDGCMCDYNDFWRDRDDWINGWSEFKCSN